VRDGEKKNLTGSRIMLYDTSKNSQTIIIGEPDDTVSWWGQNASSSVINPIAMAALTMVPIKKFHRA
jgi:hypothetical protein